MDCVSGCRWIDCLARAVYAGIVFVSVPDKDLDEPDEALCKPHGKPRPCRYCRFEWQMQRAEELREQVAE